MTRTLWFALMLLAPAAALADDPAAKPAPERPLEQMAWLVGTWRGEGKMMGRPFTDETTYEWLFERRFIRWRYAAYMGQGDQRRIAWRDTSTLAYDRRRKQLRWFTFGVDGSLGGGSWRRQKTAADAPPSWLVEGAVGDHGAVRQVLTRTGPDSFTSKAEKQHGDRWVVFMTGTYTRVKPPARE